MIHIAIFDIKNDGQSLVQCLCDFSTNFPDELCGDVEQICYRFGDAGRSMQISPRPSIRFSPLNDQQYLLSVILRMPADPQQGIPRAYNRITNYVMDQAQTDELLAMPNWCFVAENLAQLACRPAQQQEELLKNGWKDSLGSIAGNPPAITGDLAMALIMGGILRETDKKIRIVQDGLGEDYFALEWLMRQLAPALRRNVRFITNVTMPSEETGTCLSFCTGAAADSMAHSGNQGGELADLCTFRDGRLGNHRFLQKEAETARAIEMASDHSIKLAQVFLQEDDIEKYLTLLRNDWRKPEATLKTLSQICGEKSAVVFLAHGNHGYAPEELGAILKAKPRWLKSYPILSSYLKKQCARREKSVAPVDGPAAPISGPAQQEEEMPPAKKRPGSALLALGILALLALLGLLLAFIGAFDFIAAEEAILLTVESQVYIVRMFCAVGFALLFAVFFALLLLVTLIRIRKK